MSEERSERIRRAEQALDEACRNGFKFRASVPANPREDSDLLIRDGLNAARELLREREKVAGSSRAEGQAQDAQAEGPGSPSSAEQPLRAMRLALEVALEVLIERGIMLPGWEQDWGSDTAVAQCIEVAKRNARQVSEARQLQAGSIGASAAPRRVCEGRADGAIGGIQGGSLSAQPRNGRFDYAEAMLAESSRRAAGAKEGE